MTIPADGRVRLVRCKYGPRVVPGTVVAKKGDKVEFFAVDGGPYRVTGKPFLKEFEVRVGEPSEVTIKGDPGCYAYEVFDTASEFHAAGNSAPVIIIEPD